MNDATGFWLLRLLKGVFIGSGFILPGVSGGALAAVFGMYERMIMFLANPIKNFRENFLFFLPVGLGGLGGVFIFSVLLSFFFETAETQLIWFFIGCIAGTFPSLWKQAGAEGRKNAHMAVLGLCLFGATFFLLHISRYVDGGGSGIPLNPLTWAMAGGIIALGSIIPGLSPSNILLFLHLYAPMANGIASLDFGVILPLGAGAGAAVLLFSRFAAFLFKKAYAALFHGILGFVLASTLMIIPFDYNHLSLGGLMSIIAGALGIALGRWMCRLEGG